MLSALEIKTCSGSSSCFIDWYLLKKMNKEREAPPEVAKAENRAVIISSSEDSPKKSNLDQWHPFRMEGLDTLREPADFDALYAEYSQEITKPSPDPAVVAEYERILGPVARKFTPAERLLGAPESQRLVEGRFRDGSYAAEITAATRHGLRLLKRAGISEDRFQQLLRAPALLATADSSSSARELTEMSDQEFQELLESFGGTEEGDPASKPLALADISPASSTESSEEDDTSDPEFEDNSPEAEHQLISAVFTHGATVSDMHARRQQALAQFEAFAPVAISRKKKSSKARWSAEELVLLVESLASTLGPDWKSKIGNQSGKQHAYQRARDALKAAGYQRSYDACANKANELAKRE